MMTSNLLNATIDAINNYKITFEPTYLSNLTHSHKWRQKYIKKKKFEEAEDTNTLENFDKKDFDNSMSYEDIKDFAVNILSKKCPKFVNYVVDKINIL